MRNAKRFFSLILSIMIVLSVIMISTVGVSACNITSLSANPSVAPGQSTTTWEISKSILVDGPVKINPDETATVLFNITPTLHTATVGSVLTVAGTVGLEKQYCPGTTTVSLKKNGTVIATNTYPGSESSSTSGPENCSSTGNGNSGNSVVYLSQVNYSLTDSEFDANASYQVCAETQYTKPSYLAKKTTGVNLSGISATDGIVTPANITDICNLPSGFSFVADHGPSAGNQTGITTGVGFNYAVQIHNDGIYLTEGVTVVNTATLTYGDTSIPATASFTITTDPKPSPSPQPTSTPRPYVPPLNPTSTPMPTPTPTPKPTPSPTPAEVKDQQVPEAPAKVETPTTEQDNTIVDDSVPAAPITELPKTGGMPAGVLYGLGGFITTAGVLLRKRQR